MTPASRRIFYAAGPGDVAGTFRHWLAGHDDPSQVAVTYSAQFFDLCRELDADGLAMSTNASRQRIESAGIRVVQRPAPLQQRSGLLYHLGRVAWALRVTLAAWRFRADVALVADTEHYFALGLLPLLGIKVVPVLHNVVWPKHRDVRGVHRLVRRLNARFFRRRAAGFVVVSQDVADQVRQALGGADVPIEAFAPTYRRATFADVPVVPPPMPPMRVLYAGRIERDKGVFDLLEIARQLHREGHDDIEFDLCGDGRAMPELTDAVARAGLGERFRCHGHLDRPAMRNMFNRCHAVIVPTTSDFLEGFNKVVAEAVLAHRPVITSSVCPALEYVRDAVLEVPPDDVVAYREAILRLRDDAALYRSKQQACGWLREQFFDPQRSWAAGVRRILAAVGLDGASPAGASANASSYSGRDGVCLKSGTEA